MLWCGVDSVVMVLRLSVFGVLGRVRLMSLVWLAVVLCLVRLLRRWVSVLTVLIVRG